MVALLVVAILALSAALWLMGRRLLAIQSLVMAHAEIIKALAEVSASHDYDLSVVCGGDGSAQ